MFWLPMMLILVMSSLVSPVVTESISLPYTTIETVTYTLTFADDYMFATANTTDPSRLAYETDSSEPVEETEGMHVSSF
jgi:hypothetical protein